MKILLTGATGFVGSHLLVGFKEHELILLGRSCPEGFSGRFIQTTFGSEESYDQAVLGIDVIVHVAARAHIMNESAADPILEYRSFNRDVTLALASAASKAGVKRFIFVSTIKVNGEETSVSQGFSSQDDVHPLDPYAISKYEAELGLKDICSGSDMRFVIIRPPLIYGAGVKGNFASLSRLASLPLPIPFGAIRHNRRSMVSVYNLVSLVRACLEHEKAVDQTFLVSDDQDVSTRKLFELLAAAAGRRVFLLFVPVCIFSFLGRLFQRQSLVERLCGSLVVDIEHTINTLGWSPEFSVEQSMALTVADESRDEVIFD